MLNAEQQFKISICAIVKDESDLQEWIDYHKRIGFDDIIIANDSDKEIKALDCIVLEHPFKNQAGRQMKVYTWLLNNYKNNYDWIAFIDCDEFIFPKIPIKELLEQYKDYGGLGINWVAFGTSGHNERQDGVLRNYTFRTPIECVYNNHIKTIVNTKYATGCYWNPHCFSYNDGKHCVNENFELIPDAFNPHTENLIRINHYYTKSKEDWELKIKRGRADSNEKHQWEYYHNVDSISTIYDNGINELVLNFN